MKPGWEIRTLGEVCEFQNGFAFKSSTFTDTGEPIIRISDIQNDEVIDTNVVYFNPSSYHEDLSRFIVYPGDILIAMSGGTTGKLGMNNTQRCFYLNQRVGVFRENKALLNHEFLFHFLHTKSEESLRISAGAAQPNLSTAQIKAFEIPVPSLTEQQRIVDILDREFAKIDALKANAEKSLQAAKDLFQATLKKELEPKEGWEIKTFGEVGTFQRGGGFIKSDFVVDGFPCIHYGQIHMKLGTATYSHFTCIPKELATKSKIASPGDIIVAITSEDVAGSCKSTAWMGDYDVAVGAHAAIFKHCLNPLFVSYFIQSCYFQREKEAYTHGFKVVEIKPSDIAKIPIHFPSLNEQQRIVEVLGEVSERVEALQANVQKTIPLCDDLKQALLRKAFNGEL